MSDTPTITATTTETSRIDYLRNGACVCNPPTLTETETLTQTETLTETQTISATISITEEFTVITPTIHDVDFSDFETPTPGNETERSGSYSHGGRQNLNQNSSHIDKWKKDARTGRAKEETKAFMLGTGLASEEDLLHVCIHVEWRGWTHGPYVWDGSPSFSSNDLPDPIPVVFDYKNDQDKGLTYKNSSSVNGQVNHVFEECAKISFSVCENPIAGPEEGTLLKRVKINTNCGWKIPQDIIDKGEAISCEVYWPPVDFEENECLLMASLLQETGEVRIERSRLELRVDELDGFTEKGADFELGGYYARVGKYHDISPESYQMGSPIEGFAAKGKFVEKGTELFEKMNRELSKGAGYAGWRTDNLVNGFVFRKVFNLDGSSAFNDPVFIYKEFTYVTRGWGCLYGYGFRSNPYQSYPWNPYSPPRPKPYGEGFMRSWPDPSQMSSQMVESQFVWDDTSSQFQFVGEYSIDRDGPSCEEKRVVQHFRDQENKWQQADVTMNCCSVFRSCWCDAGWPGFSYLGNIGGIFGNGETVCCQMDLDFAEYTLSSNNKKYKQHILQNLYNDVGMVTWVASKSLPTDGSQVNARTWWWYNSMIKRWYSGDYRVSYPLTREVRSKHILFGDNYRNSHAWKDWNIPTSFRPIFSFNRFSMQPVENPIVFETPTSTPQTSTATSQY